MCANASGSGFDREQQGEQSAPRIADDGWRIEPQLRDDAVEIVDVGLPSDRRSLVGLRLSAPTLIVKNELVVVGKLQHLRQQIVVMRSGPPMQHEQRCSADGSVSNPVKRNCGRRREPGFAWCRNGRWRHGRKITRARNALGTPGSRVVADRSPRTLAV